jgi:hydroxymethylpyrimidine/phosphomethylpyrimidine kinase
MKKFPRALTIAGSDSGGCAGIQADIKTFSALGVFGMSAITAITAQNTKQVADVEAISIHNITLQIDMVLSDIGANAVKTGMLFSSEIIEAVADRLSHWGAKNLVVDPVMVASSGATLLLPDAIKSMSEKLFPLATVITPNIPEAELLSGIKIEQEQDIYTACEILYNMGAKKVLLKGGHRQGGVATDLLFDGVNFHKFSSDWVDTNNLHGTGCTYSAAIAAFLAKGLTLADSVKKAKEYISGAIKHGKNLYISESNGPVDHFWDTPCKI